MRYSALDREVEIRQVSAEDNEAEVDRLFHTFHALLADHSLRRYWLDGFLGKGSPENPKGELIIANSETRLIGAIAFFNAKNTSGCPFYDRGDVASIGPFAIMPEFQGHGLASVMLRYVEDLARESGATELALDIAPGNTEAMNRFIKEGYRYVESARWPGSTRACVVLSKVL